MTTANELALARFAAPRYGVFTKRHALSFGVSERTVRRRLQTEAWEVLHTGVYCLAGTPPSWHRDQMAACDWSGGAAAGRAAGFLYGLPDCDDPSIEVITPERRRSMPMRGVIVRVSNRLPADQIVVVQQIPTMSIERTLMSLCAQLPERQAAIPLDNALFRRLTTAGNIDHFLFRTARRGRNGCKALRRLTKKRIELDVVPNTPLETVIFEMLADSHLDMPEIQYVIRDNNGGFVARPDFVYPAEKIVVEGHSKLWHLGAEAESRDRDRHARLIDIGYEIHYLAWPDATRYSVQTIRMLEQRLNERRAGLLLPGSGQIGGNC